MIGAKMMERIWMVIWFSAACWLSRLRNAAINRSIALLASGSSATTSLIWGSLSCELLPKNYDSRYEKEERKIAEKEKSRKQKS